MKATILQLQQKTWYRLLKVFYTAAFIPVIFFLIIGVFSIGLSREMLLLIALYITIIESLRYAFLYVLNIKGSTSMTSNLLSILSNSKPDEYKSFQFITGIKSKADKIFLSVVLIVIVISLFIIVTELLPSLGLTTRLQ